MKKLNLCRCFCLSLGLVLSLWALPVRVAAADSIPRETIIISGGPALRYFERGKRNSHDKSWRNFIVAAELQIKKLQPTTQAGDRITWMVFRPGYQTRAQEEQDKVLEEIKAKAAALKVDLLWFDTTDQLVNYLNSGQDRRRMPIGRFDYFGHSNRACFLFDYSNHVDGLSTMYLHENQLARIRQNAFAKDATAQSWGCHSGESYSAAWRKRFGTPMLGAIGKTDYSNGALPTLSRSVGRWTQ